MKLHERAFVAFLALGLVLAACTGGSDDVAAPTAVPVVETPTAAEADPTPTVEVVTPEATDEERLAAVVAAFDSAIEAGDAPESLIAYDLLDSTVAEDGVVTLNICAWTGDTVFDTVRDSIWRTAVDDDGSVTATHITTPVTSGDCINSYLIETALATVQEYDTLLIEASEAPSGFGTDPRTLTLLDESFRESLKPTFDDWAADDLSVIGSRAPGLVLDSLIADLLWRRYTRNDVSVVEFVVCRDMVAERGIYKGGVLIDDGRDENSTGLHSIDLIQLRADRESPAEFTAVGRASLIWSDCLTTDDWPAAAGRWREGPVPFEVLTR